jgi:hypothetical protein
MSILVSFWEQDSYFLFWKSAGDLHVNSLTFTTVRRGMLHPMQQTATNPPSSTSPSFAGLLAALTAPAPRTAWNTDDLATTWPP